jgi:stage II sporulation protein AA (anti-sigma F factor antagonist)
VGAGGVKPFNVSIDDHDVQVLVVEGELDMATAPVLDRYLSALDGEVRLECEGLTFIDSRGLSLFVDTHQRLSDTGGRLVLANLAPNCRRLIELMKLDELLVLDR